MRVGLVLHGASGGGNVGSVMVNACQILMGRRIRRDFVIGLSVMRKFFRRSSIKALHNSLTGMLHVVPSY